MLLYHREGSGGRAERKIDGMQKKKQDICLLIKQIETKMLSCRIYYDYDDDDDY